MSKPDPTGTGGRIVKENCEHCFATDYGSLLNEIRAALNGEVGR